jgi:hypothetical protein
MRHAWERSEKCTRFSWESDHSKERGVDGRMGSECVLRRLAGGMWSGFNWLGIGTDGGLLLLRR